MKKFFIFVLYLGLLTIGTIAFAGEDGDICTVKANEFIVIIEPDGTLRKEVPSKDLTDIFLVGGTPWFIAQRLNIKVDGVWTDSIIGTNDNSGRVYVIRNQSMFNCKPSGKEGTLPDCIDNVDPISKSSYRDYCDKRYKLEAAKCDMIMDSTKRGVCSEENKYYYYNCDRNVSAKDGCGCKHKTFLGDFPKECDIWEWE